MNNYKLTIQYDGSNYAGWQIQENSLTIQQKITRAIEVITKEKVNLIGSGRTDAGVHALGQIANFRIDRQLDIYRFKHSLNAILPVDISITQIGEVHDSFHSRFDARKRSYLYFITRVKSPFYYKYSYLYREKLDTSKLNSLSKLMLGERDFDSFSRKNSDVFNKRCIIYDAHWKETKGFVIFYVQANRFLHGMVRTIVGTLLKASKTSLPEKYIQEVLDKKDREAAGEAVSPKGLFLYKVNY